MPFYVYIIKSLKDNSYYKGYTEDPVKRLKQHNDGDSRYTSTKAPWLLVYTEECLDKRTALIREKNLKKATHQGIEAIIASQKNSVEKFIDSDFC